METVPDEAVKNNVFGTWNTAKAAAQNNVQTMILISTDKAVNPTNIMGATKRVCEMIVQHADSVFENTRFAAVRFGNVLGSNGSVIPLFKKQIEERSDLTVTHPEMIRYFMTISEASQLVLTASAMAKGGEIFVLDMGEPVRIADLAKNMIRFSGLTLGKDINIRYIGLRPGEKLYEELLMSEEGLDSTQNKKIFIGKKIDFDSDSFIAELEELRALAEDPESSPKMIEKKLMEIVPTFRRAPQGALPPKGADAI
ncbi:MAG: polysaccharide biosynthesis protein [Clostridia bacterium]|nr:polysaccharide biosynthesis protein [Clostridia bacterium]